MRRRKLLYASCFTLKRLGANVDLTDATCKNAKTNKRMETQLDYDSILWSMTTIF